MASCHPWLATGIILYLVAAVTISIRGSFRRADPTAHWRKRTEQWMRTSLAAFEPTLLQFGVSATFLTMTQLAVSLLAGVAYAQGCVFLGGWLMLACGVLDIIDGSLARHTGQASRRGAFLDSVIDRYAEFFTFLGLAMLFVHSRVLWLVAFGFLGSVMVSYARARAESLGIECRGGLMQRAERYIVLGVTSFLSTAWSHIMCRPSHSVLIFGLLFLAVSANFTALSRVRVALKDLREQ